MTDLVKCDRCGTPFSIGSFSFPQNTIFPIWVLSVNC